MSPLLANMALHGMEEIVAKQKPRGTNQLTPTTVRYADDFVILHPDKEVVEQCRKKVEAWLKGMGLELKPSKTRITHTLHEQEGQLGFDFLGVNVRQYPVGKYRTGKNGHGKPLGFKTFIKPSQEAVKRHVRKMGEKVQALRGAPQEKLIFELNPILRGWANYYRTVVAKETFAKADHILFQQIWQWAKWRHNNKRGKWMRARYWRKRGPDNWVFAPPGEDGKRLANHAAVKVKRQVKVEGNASPYDGNLVYWAKRNYEHPLTRNRAGYVLKLQKGKCAWCGLCLKDGDLIELDHIIPKS